MKTPPKLDYETPAPEEAAGFLATYNPNATVQSVLRNAITQCLYAAILWLIGWMLHYWENWWYFFALVAIFALWGALQEWLVPRRDNVYKSNQTIVDVRDDWSDEDIADLTRHSLKHADESESEEQIGK